MLQRIRQEIERIIGGFNHADVYPSPYMVRSYAQEDEDMILRCSFQTEQRGFYVDIGAHDPMRY
jgi:hypothetical protein